MEESEGVIRLFYELSSETRLSILHELNRNPAKMNELVKKLGLTLTEAARQIRRLDEFKLIYRQPDGSWLITQYGKLALHLSHSYEFITKNRDDILTRDIFSLPYWFIDRLGELSEAKFTMNTIENFNLAENALLSAEDHIWWLCIEPTEQMKNTIAKLSSQGVKIKYLVKKDSIDYNDDLLKPIRGVEIRTLDNIPVLILCTDIGAGVNLLALDGRTDYALFHGRDTKTMKFASDLFTYYWAQGKPLY